MTNKELEKWKEAATHPYTITLGFISQDERLRITMEKTNLIALVDEVLQLRAKAEAYEKAANEWMESYDKLKRKYEPLYGVVGDVADVRDRLNIRGPE